MKAICEVDLFISFGYFIFCVKTKQETEAACVYFREIGKMFKGLVKEMGRKK